jgi:hypothetical protein
MTSNPLPVLGVCEFCAVIFKDVMTHIGTLLPSQCQPHLDGTVCYPNEMITILNNLKRSIFKQKRLHHSEHLTITVQRLTGSQSSKHSKTKWCPKTQFQWTKYDLRWMNPAYLIRLMFVIVNDGLNIIAITAVSDKDKLLIEQGRILIKHIQNKLYKMVKTIPKRNIALSCFNTLVMHVNTTRVNLLNVYFSRTSVPTSINALGIKDVCELCFKFISTIATYVRELISNDDKIIQTKITGIYANIVWYIREFQADNFERGEVAIPGQPPFATVQILGVTGISVALNAPNGKMKAKSLFQWEEMSPEEFKTIHPLTLIHTMTIVLKQGLGHVGEKLESKSRGKIKSHLINCVTTLHSLMKELIITNVDYANHCILNKLQNVDIVQIKLQTMYFEKGYSRSYAYS